MNFSGDVTSYAAGDAVIQNGTLTTNDGIAMKGFDSGGRDVAYGQTGGTLGGSGTIDGSLLADAGVIAPGASPGTLIITGNFIQNAGSTLRIQIAGRTAGEFDQLRVDGGVTLGGRLEASLLDSFAPDLGERFALLITTNLSGAFSQLSVPQGISIAYTNTGVVPVVTGVVPSQILGPALTNGAAVFSFGTVSNRYFTVEWTPALSPATWQAWTNLTGGGTKLSVSVPVSEAARRFFRVSQP